MAEAKKNKSKKDLSNLTNPGQDEQLELKSQMDRIQNVPEFARKLWMDMVALRRNLFYYNIEIVQYYLYGEINKEPSSDIRAQLLYAFEDPMLGTYYFPQRKMDTMASRIADQAAANYGAALMPRGLKSFSVEIKNKLREREARKTGILQNYQDIQRAKNQEATEIFQEFLEDNGSEITTPITQAIKDYLEFGSSIVILDSYTNDIGQVEFNLRHIPFRNCYFFSNVEDKNFFFGYEEKLTSGDYKIKYGDLRPNQTSSSFTAPVVQHLYVPLVWYNMFTSEIGGEILEVEPDNLRYTLVHMSFDSMGFLQFPRTINTKIDNHMVFTARNSSRSDSAYQIYGKGAAVQAISSIKDANFFRGIIASAAACTVEPPIALPPGCTINEDRRATGGRPGRVSLRPGAVNVLKNDTPSGLPMSPSGGSIQLLSQAAPQQLQVSFESYKLAIEQIEGAFSSMVFEISDRPNRTATEIIEQRESNIRVFRGFATAFFLQKIQPLMTQFFYIANHNCGNPIQSEFGDNIVISTYSFENEQREQIDFQKLTQFLQVKAMIAQGIELDDKEQDYINKTMTNIFLNN